MTTQQTATLIIQLFAKEFSVPVKKIMTRCNRTEVVKARWCAIALTHEITGMDGPALGELFQKDHTTIYYALKKFATAIETGHIDRRNYESVRNKILNEKTDTLNEVILNRQAELLSSTEELIQSVKVLTQYVRRFET